MQDERGGALLIEKAVLVYQGPIANVFAVETLNLAPYGRRARRLFQGSCGEAAAFARGLGAAGTVVRSARCERRGDISDQPWVGGVQSLAWGGRVDVRLGGGLPAEAARDS